MKPSTILRPSTFLGPSKLKKTITKGSIVKNKLSPWFSSCNKNELVQATIKQENCTRSTEQDFDKNGLNPTKNKDAKKQNSERNVTKKSSGNLLLRLKQYLSRSKQNKKTDLVLSNPAKQEEIKKEIKYELKEEEISDSDEDIRLKQYLNRSKQNKETNLVLSNPPKQEEIKKEIKLEIEEEGEISDSENQELKAETSLFNPLLVTAKLADNLWPYKTENQKSERNTGLAELKAGYFDTRIGKWQPIWQDQSQNQLTSGQNQLTSGSCLATSGQHQPPQDGDESNKVTEQKVFNHYPADQNSKKSCQITTNQKSSPVSSIKNETADDQNPEKTCQINANEKLRPIIIDGQNVAFEYGREISGMAKFNARGIEICVEYFKKRGHKEIIIWLPEHRKKNRDFPDNPAILEDLGKNIKWTTARKLTSGKCFASYDDR